MAENMPPRWPAVAGALLLALGGASAQAEAPPPGGGTDPRIIERYRQMLADNPVEGTALERLWKIAEKEGFISRLLTDARQAAKKSKGGFREEMVLGLLLQRSGKTESAQEAFARAAVADPKSPLPHLALARLLPPEKQAAELEAAAALLPADSPQRAELWQKLGEAHLAAGELEKAAQAWEAWVAEAPGQPELRQRLARLYVEHGLPERALAHYAVLEKEGEAPLRVEALRGSATIHSAAGRYPEALEALSRASSQVAPGHWLRAELATEMVRIAQQGGLLPELEHRWQAEAAAHPREATPWLQLADLYAAQEKPEEEAAALERALALEPAATAALARLARLLSRQEKLEEAAAVYARLPAGPEGADLAFERAALDIRLGRLEEAAARLREAAVAAPEDVALRTRVTSFMREHRMHAALEEWLRSPEGSDPEALAEFLFAQRRPEAAREVLRAIVRNEDPPERRAEIHRRAAEIYRQAGDATSAIEEYRAAAVTTPDSASAWMALGDFLLSRPGSGPEAAKAFSRAYGAAKGEQREEADQRIFRALEMEATPATAQTPARGGSEAQRIAETLLSAPVRDLFIFRAPERGPGLALAQQITRLQKEAEATERPTAWLRLARWQFWSGSLDAAREAAEKAEELEPTLLAASKLRVAIALAAGDRAGALALLEKIAEAHPKRLAEWRKQMVQVYFQMGQPDEALAILQELAASGEPAALADLAHGQQQADRWYDALATWEQLYRRADGARRAECIAPMVRAMQRLEMNRRVAEFLWEAIRETPDEGLRAPLLNDLIQHCRAKGMTRWLIETLETQAAATGAAADQRALAQVLKATGRQQEAFGQLLKAAQSAKDRAAAEEELVRQAEEMRDLAAAAEHQATRIRVLPGGAAPEEWEKLARLQEAALRYREAGATRAEMVRRFPRDVAALLRHARFFNKWGENAQALEMLRKARQIDATQPEVAVSLLRQPGASEAERVAAARAVLAAPPPQGPQPLRLPPESEPMGNRVRACFALFASGPRRDGAEEVLLWDENQPAATEAEWRLEAIAYLARRITPLERPAWVARWLVAGGPPSEALWALSGAGAGREVFTFLQKRLEAAPGERPLAGALIWSGLRLGLWEPLGQWVWAPQRTPEEMEIFRTLLAEWAGAGRPLEPALFAAATPAQVWSYAEVLASRRRHTEAAQFGQRLYDAMPGPRSAIGYPLATWLLEAGQTAAAIEILRQIAPEPANALDAAPYAAQRLLYRLLPEGEREVWAARLRDALQTRPANGGGSPLHTLLSNALLQSLAGKEAAPEWARVARLRAADVDEETPATDRAWQFLLGTGVQLQHWGLRPAAAALWKQAVADPAAIRLQGERATAYAEEIHARLLAGRLVQAGSRHPVLPLLQEAARKGEPASLNAVAMVLDTEGYKALAAEVLDFIHQAEPGSPVLRLLAACKAANDPERARAVVKRWLAAPGEDSVSTPAALDFLASDDPALARQTAEALAATGPGDQRVLERLARYRLAAKEWELAAQSYRQLLPLQPGNASFRIGLLQALAGPGTPAAAEVALEELRAGGGGTPALEALRVELLLQAGRGEEARTAAASLLRGGPPQFLRQAAEALAKGGRREDALALISAAVDDAAAAGKPRAAFDLQFEGLRLLTAADTELRPRWQTRLRTLAGSYPDLLSRYFEWVWRETPAPDRHRDFEAVWDDGHGPFIAGAWYFSSLLETSPDAAPALLGPLLERPDALAPIAIWLEQRCRSAGRYDLAATLGEWVLGRMPDEAPSLLNRVRSLQALGQKEAAAALLESASPRIALHPELAGDLALAAQELGRADLARPFFITAVEADPAALRYQVHLGYARLLLEEGDFPAARRALRRAFRNPANREVGAVVDYLRRTGRPAEEVAADLGLPPALATEVARPPQ